MTINFDFYKLFSVVLLLLMLGFNYYTFYVLGIITTAQHAVLYDQQQLQQNKDCGDEKA